MLDRDLASVLVENLGAIVTGLLNDHVPLNRAGWQVRNEVQEQLVSLAMVAAMGGREDLKADLMSLSDQTGGSANTND